MPYRKLPILALRRSAAGLTLGMLFSTAYAGAPAYLSDTPPEVAPAHQERIDSAWEKSKEGRSVSSTCGFFGALIENPFGVAPLNPQETADALAAQAVCYVQAISRSIHYFLETKPDQCRILSNRMATAHGTALMGLTDEAQRQALQKQLDANIGDLVRERCPQHATLILEH